ncbi:MAG TPA: Ada metal-binding domain-containing protein [Tepidisphaeraceae bacterium]
MIRPQDGCVHKPAALVLSLIVAAGHSDRAIAVQSPQANYVACQVRMPFHRPDCKGAQKISPKNLEVFETREQAIAAGHRPCRECQP